MLECALGVALGVPLVTTLAGLLWLTAKRRYARPQTTVLVASGSGKPELHDYSSGPASADNGGHSESYAVGFTGGDTGRNELPIQTGYRYAELGRGERW